MKKMTAIALAMLGLPAFHAASRPQDASTTAGTQTTAGAHQFIQQAFAQGTVRLRVDVGQGWNYISADSLDCKYRDEYGGFMTGMQRVWSCQASENYQPAFARVDDYRVLGSSTSAECATTVNTVSPSFNQRDERSSVSWLTYRKTPYPLNGPFMIDWRKVAEVKQDGASVIITGTKPKLMLVMPSDALAARMTYAMEFVRGSCDPMASTGF